MSEAQKRAIAPICLVILSLSVLLVFFSTRNRLSEYGLVADYYTIEKDGTDSEQYDGSCVTPDINQWYAQESLFTIGATDMNRKIVWTGRLSPTISGSYQLSTDSTNCVKVWLNGRLIIDSEPSSNTTGTDESSLVLSDYVELSQSEYVSLRMEWTRESVEDGSTAKLYWQRAGWDEPETIAADCLYPPEGMYAPSVTYSKDDDGVDDENAQLDLAEGSTSGTIRIRGKHLDVVKEVNIVPSTAFSSRELVATSVIDKSNDSLTFDVPNGLGTGSWRIVLMGEDDKRWVTNASFRVTDKEKEPLRTEYPCTSIVRDDWQSLNGAWEFGFDVEETGLAEEWYLEDAKTSTKKGEDNPYDLRIQVPFSWTSDLSGVGEGTNKEIGWYRRSFEIDSSWNGSNIFLRFGAVDADAMVWVNEQLVTQHRGGYTPFEVDVTNAVHEGSNSIVIRVFDGGRYGSAETSAMIGKQGVESPAGHTQVSGIWQSVWLERRGSAWVRRCETSTDLNANSAQLLINLGGEGGQATVKWKLMPVMYDTSDSVDAAVDRTPIEGEATVSVLPLGVGGQLTESIDLNAVELWSADRPIRYVGTISVEKDGKVTDTVNVSIGFRQIAVEHVPSLGGSVLTVNGVPEYLDGTIVQGYWSDGLYTAPNADMYREDVLRAKELGFNAIRVYEKIEDPEFYEWCDRIGIYVIQDIPTTTLLDITKDNAKTACGRALVEHAVKDIATRDVSHPSIVSVSLPGIDTADDRRDNVAADGMSRSMWQESLYTRAKAMWSGVLVTDSPLGEGTGHPQNNDINVYTAESLDDWAEARYDVRQAAAATFKGSAWNCLAKCEQTGQPLVLYGHVCYSEEDPTSTWLWHEGVLRQTPGVAGAFWSNLYDVEYDQTGLLTYDRGTKESLKELLESQSSYYAGKSSISVDTPGQVSVRPDESVELNAYLANWTEDSLTARLEWKAIAIGDSGSDDNSFFSGAEDITIEAQSREVCSFTLNAPPKPCSALLVFELKSEGGNLLARDVRIMNTTLFGSIGQIVMSGLGAASES